MELINLKAYPFYPSFVGSGGFGQPKGSKCFTLSRKNLDEVIKEMKTNYPNDNPPNSEDNSTKRYNFQNGIVITDDDESNPLSLSLYAKNNEGLLLLLNEVPEIRDRLLSTMMRTRL